MSAAWKCKALSEVCEIKPSKGEAKRKLKDSSLVSFVPMEDLGIDQKFLEPNVERKLSQVAGSYTYFADGDVLLAKITPCFENGKLGIAKGLMNGIGFGSSEYIVFRPNDELSNEYLYYFLLKDSFRAAGIATMSGAVGHKRVSKEFIERCPIPIPPLPEQQRIVAILDEAFAGLATATANAEKNLKNARELLQSVMNSLLGGNQSGKPWPSASLGSLTEQGRGISYGVVKPGRSDPSGIRLIKSQQVRDGWMDLSEDFRITKALDKEYARTRLQGGEVLLNLVGASIGRSVIAPDEIRGANVTRAIAVIPVPRDLSLWVHFNLRSRAGQRLIQSSTGGTAQPVFNLADVKSLPIPMAPLGARQAIVGSLVSVNEYVGRLKHLYEDRSRALADLKQSILQKAFSGELTGPPSQAIKEAAE